MNVRRGDRPATRLVAGLLLVGSLVLSACDNSSASDGPPGPDPSPLASPPDRAATPIADPGQEGEEAEVAVAYLAFWQAVQAAADPPDPDHPDLATTAGDPQLTQLRDVLSEYREQGYVRRGDHQHNPVVREFVDGQDAAIVDDCNELDPEAGLYDAETGERVEGGGEPGDRELLEARLELVNGTWKVVNVNVVEEDSTCVPAS